MGEGGKNQGFKEPEAIIFFPIFSEKHLSAFLQRECDKALCAKPTPSHTIFLGYCGTILTLPFTEDIFRKIHKTHSKKNQLMHMKEAGLHAYRGTHMHPHLSIFTDQFVNSKADACPVF